MAVGREARDKLLNGQKLYQERARKALPILVELAGKKAKITYSELAERLGMPNPRNLNHVLYCIGSAIEELSEDWHGDKYKIPPIEALVVNKNTRLPGAGIAYFIHEYTGNKAEKKKIMDEMGYKMIFDYPDWPLVLKELLQENG